MITLHLHVACAQHPRWPLSLKHCSSSQTQSTGSKCLSPLTFKGVVLPVIPSISQSLIVAVSLIQISAHLWMRLFYMHVERAVELSLLQTELISLGREFWCGTKPAWTGLVKHRTQQGANIFLNAIKI